MQIGLLWFDNDPSREVAAKVEDAAQRYREKFGVPPNTCYVNQAAWTGDTSVSTTVRIIPVVNILPNHFWVGVEEQRA